MYFLNILVPVAKAQLGEIVAPFNLTRLLYKRQQHGGVLLQTKEGQRKEDEGK